MKRMTFLTLLLGALCASVASAEMLSPNLEMYQAEVKYRVSFPLKTVIGKADYAKGKVACEKGECQFLVAAEVKTFDSGDRNRDLHMWEVTHALEHPYVVVKGKFPQEMKGENLAVDLEVEFAGVKHTEPRVPLHITRNGQGYVVDGSFDISLKNYKVEAPSLLGISIDDKVAINLHALWH